MLSPLDWGLGHTTRCIPLIRCLLELDCQVIVAVNAKQQALLMQEFDQLRFVPLEGYGLQYGRTAFQTTVKILFQIPKILSAIRRENRWLNGFVQSNPVHAVLSDNRYGFCTKRLPSVFITHQLTIKTPFGKISEKWLRQLNYRLIKKFDACWVPDYGGEPNLAGELSHPPLMPAVPVRYLGRLTRLQVQPAAGHTTAPLLIILSGPEPQRSMLEEILLLQLQYHEGPAVLVRGLPAETGTLQTTAPHLVIHNCLPSKKLETLIREAGIIISRSGYSTVMDIAGRGKACIFVPTPGQSEQEYLAVYLKQKRCCIWFSQKEFSLPLALQEAARFPFAGPDGLPGKIYQTVLKDFVEKLKQPVRDQPS